MITNPWQLLANLTLVQTYIPQFIQTGLNPSWSLTLEYAFYAVLPILGVLLFAMRRRTNLRPFTIAAAGAGVLLVIGFVGRAFVPLVNAATGVTDPQLQEWGANWSAVFIRSFLANADNFAVGMLAAVVIVAMEQDAVAARLSSRVRFLSTVALLPTVAVFCVLVLVRSAFASAALGVFFALFLLIVVAPLARGEDSKLARWMEVAPVRYIGKISLSAYLWHFPVLIVLGRWGLMAGDTLQGMLYNVVVVVGVTVLVSTVTYYLVEQPVMTMTRRYRHRLT
jgi:peptidoglycan/LPS O-acetylase OafA/YrhL